ACGGAACAAAGAEAASLGVLAVPAVDGPSVEGPSVGVPSGGVLSVVGAWAWVVCRSWPPVPAAPGNTPHPATATTATAATAGVNIPRMSPSVSRCLLDGVDDLDAAVLGP